MVFENPKQAHLLIYNKKIWYMNMTNFNLSKCQKLLQNMKMWNIWKLLTWMDRLIACELDNDPQNNYTLVARGSSKSH
jgi:hypothetical protein